MQKLYDEIESLSFEEFAALLRFVDKMRNDRAEAILDEAHKKASRLIKHDNTVSGKKNNKGKSAKPAKYRDPQNADNTWSGYGRQPEWVKDYIANGGNKSDLIIG